MKLLLLFLISISIHAQDSLLVSLAVNIDPIKDNQSSILINEFIPRSASLLEMKNSRIWKNSNSFNLNSETKKMTKIEFVKQKNNFIDSDMFLIMVGSAIALGASAAYFKLESDNYYEQYQETKDKKYLNNTDNYDLYSGLSLGALQLNFGYLVYKFLTD